MDRRDFIKAAAVSAAASTAARASGGSAPDTYPKRELGKLADLTEGEAQNVYYPDEQSPVLLVKLGAPVEGGAGPDRDVVAYSARCPHRGCLVSYRKARMICSCHFSAFDPAKDGECYQGPSTEYLPRVKLSISSQGAVIAVGMEGLLWGRRANLERSKRGGRR